MYSYPGLNGDCYMQSSGKGHRTESSSFPETWKRDCAWSLRTVQRLCLPFLGPGQPSREAVRWGTSSMLNVMIKAPTPPTPMNQDRKPEHWEKCGTGVTQYISGSGGWDRDLLLFPCHSSCPGLAAGCPRHRTPPGAGGRGAETQPPGGLSARCLRLLLWQVLGLASRWYCWHTPLQKSFARGVIGGKKKQG